MAAKHSLTSNTILLTLAGGVEFGLQFAIPMIFVRNLEPAAFGQYRLLWLMAATALALAPAFMPQSLFYFLPRASEQQKRVYIGNALAWLAAAGCVAAFVASAFNPFAPDVVRSLFAHSGGMSALFIGGWVLASVMTALPTADGRARWQAGSDVGLAVLRTLLLAGAAIVTHDIRWVVAAMLAEAVARISMLLVYLLTRRGGGKIAWQWAATKTQMAYALPFALGNALFLLRVQADQWVVASMLSTTMLATFAIGAVFLPVASLIRQPLNNAMLPRLNSAYASGDLAEIRRLVGKSSAATTLMLMPVAGALWSLAPEVVQIVYTSRYVDAVPIMRVYLLGMMLNAIAVGHVLPVLDKGRFAAGSNACCLAISVVCSIAGASRWGLIGAACGSVLTLALSELWSMKVVARTLGVATFDLLPWRAIAPAVLGTGLGIAGAILVEVTLATTLLSALAWKGLAFVALLAAGFLACGGKGQLRILRGARPGLRAAL